MNEAAAEALSAAINRKFRDFEPSKGRGKQSAAVSGTETPTAGEMLAALDSPFYKRLDKAGGGFQASLLDNGEDDPSRRDYGERYRYVARLGEGGQGRVLCFHDAVLDRDVAIKVLKPPHTEERERQLENEARVGGALEHPNILPTYDLSCDETGSPFLVMRKEIGRAHV